MTDLPSMETLVEATWNATGVHPTQIRQVLAAVLPLVLGPAAEALNLDEVVRGVSSR